MAERLTYGKLSIDIEEEAGRITYKFAGDVDECFIQEKMPKKGKPEIIFDLGGINNINSCGIREWVHLVKEFTDLGAVKFVNCSVVMIDQINMVPDCAANVEIVSFKAPYFMESDEGDKEITKTIVITDHPEIMTSKKAPEFTNEETGEPLEFDALEDCYFAFLDSPNIKFQK